MRRPDYPSFLFTDSKLSVPGSLRVWLYLFFTVFYSFFNTRFISTKKPLPNTFQSWEGALGTSLNYIICNSESLLVRSDFNSSTSNFLFLQVNASVF
jgi:hypothetical protein